MPERTSELFRREADRLLWIVKTLNDPDAKEELMGFARRYAALAQRAKARESLSEIKRAG